MSNILNKIQIQGNPTVTYDLLSSAIPCYGPAVADQSGHITELYRDYEQLVYIEDKIENALYIDLFTGNLYSYTRHSQYDQPTPPDPEYFWFIPVALDLPIVICHGYQYSEHGGAIINLYSDSEKTFTVTKDEHFLYIDVDDNVMYRYNQEAYRFEQVGNDDYCVQGEVNSERTEILFNRPLVTLETTRNYLVDFFVSDGSSYSSLETTENNQIKLTFSTPLAEGTTAWATFKLVTPTTIFAQGG